MASDPGLLYHCYHCERTVQLASADTLICADCHGDFIEERPVGVPAPEDSPSASDFSFNEVDYMGPGFGQLLEDMSSLLSHAQVAPGTGHDLDPTNEDAPVILTLGPGMRPLNPILLLQGQIQNLLNLRSREYMIDNGGPARIPGTIGDYYVGPGLEHLIQQLAENDPNKYGTPPASKSAVEALPSISISEEHMGTDLAQCAVCKEELELHSQAKQLPCKHMYHPDCIFPWLEQHSTCPVCRFELPTDDPDYERTRTQGPGVGEFSGTRGEDGSPEEDRVRDSFASRSLPGQPVIARYPTETDNASQQQGALLSVQAANTTQGGIADDSNGEVPIGRIFFPRPPRLRGVRAISRAHSTSQEDYWSHGSTLLREAVDDREALRAQSDRDARRLREEIISLLASAGNDDDRETRQDEVD
eukprot:c25119_g1_i1 orf=127-1377(+)